MLAVQWHGLQRCHLMVDHVGQRSFRRLPAMVISTRRGQARRKSEGYDHHGKPNPVPNPITLYQPELSLTLNLSSVKCSLGTAQKTWSRAFVASCSFLASRRPLPFTSPDLPAFKHVKKSSTLRQGRAKIIYPLSDPSKMWLLFLTVKLTPLENRVSEPASLRQVHLARIQRASQNPGPNTRKGTSAKKCFKTSRRTSTKRRGEICPSSASTGTASRR